MLLCPLCHRHTLVQSGNVLVSDHPHPNLRIPLWRQTMALWCVKCQYIGEVPPDLRERVRERTPEFVESA